MVQDRSHTETMRLTIHRSIKIAKLGMCLIALLAKEAQERYTNESVEYSDTSEG